MSRGLAMHRTRHREVCRMQWIKITVTKSTRSEENTCIQISSSTECVKCRLLHIRCYIYDLDIIVTGSLETIVFSCYMFCFCFLSADMVVVSCNLYATLIKFNFFCDYNGYLLYKLLYRSTRQHKKTILSSLVLKFGMDLVWRTNSNTCTHLRK